MEKRAPNYPLRMPENLREKLTEKAKNNSRSLNAELIHRLENSVEAEEQAAAALAGDPHQQINVLTEQMGQLLKAIAAANLMAARDSGKVEIKD